GRGRARKAPAARARRAHRRGSCGCGAAHMSILEYVKTALVALRLNKLRSLLTTLGIIIGVGSVIVMSAIGSGASKQIEDQISSLGTNQLTIFPGSANVGGRRGGFGSAPPLTEKDLRAVRDSVPGVMA